MGLREWVQRRMARYDGGAEIPSVTSMAHALLNTEAPHAHALGEYDASSYPAELAELLRRRAEVSEGLLRTDLTTAAGRMSAIPQLQSLLRVYPHPLVYEALILGYADAGRWDEARGVAFAARDRRRECEKSPFPELQMETDRLRIWTSEDIDELRKEREGAASVE
jgi:hypothetical protein